MVALGLSAAIWLLVSLPVQGQGPVRYSAPVFVDPERAGGEPVSIQSTRFGNLVYTSHQGTTHLFRDGITGSPTGTGTTAGQDRNQVYIWTSGDAGATWQRVDAGGGFTTNPFINNGFSDPDLTQDEGGRIYDTGINLVNDSLFSSADGGHTWPDGTLQCHDGDRPWLAGAQANKVFMATDAVEANPNGSNLGHEVFTSTDGGRSCNQDGIPDFQARQDGSLVFAGFGKLQYNHRTGDLYEPYVHYESDGTTVDGVGVSVLRNGATSFTQSPVVPTTLFAHWPAIAIDAANNVYLVWDTDERSTEAGGCGGGASSSAQKDSNPKVLPNTIKLAVFSGGSLATAPAIKTIAGPESNTRYLWPWIAAGAAGKLSVVWYQSDALVDPDCQAANFRIFEAHVFDATGANPAVSVVDAAGRVVHSGSICQGGTFCVVSGRDRRLGDFFTNGIDQRGCVFIASGDTTLKDSSGAELPTSRPIFTRQVSGPSLLNGDCAASASGAATAGPNASGPGATPFSSAPVSRSAAAVALILLGLLLSAGGLWRWRRAARTS
jgi:hypothetical protein